MKAYASYAEWKKDQSAKNKRLVGALERLVEEVAPHFQKSVKWGQGCWIEGDAPKVYIHTEEDHVQFGFYRGSTMKDPDRLLVGSGKYVRHVKVRKPGDIDPDAFRALISQVAK